MFRKNKSIRIMGVTIEPGTKGHGVLTIPDALSDGSPVEVPFAAINGAKAGPTLFLSNGHDSFEIQGLEAIRRVFFNVNPKKISGTVLYCLPNPIAFRQ